MPADEKTKIEARALAIPTNLVEICHGNIVKIKEFLPHCNPNITSDAKVGVHQLAGAARAAYQVSLIPLRIVYLSSHVLNWQRTCTYYFHRFLKTVLVNSPSEEEKMRLQKLLKEIRDVEDDLLG